MVQQLPWRPVLIWYEWHQCDGVLQARQPTEAELKATSVVSLELSEVSAKVRTGPPVDDKQDMELPIWAGVLPIDQVKGVGRPQPDPELMSGLEAPQYIAQYHRLSGSAA